MATTINQPMQNTKNYKSIYFNPEYAKKSTGDQALKTQYSGSESNPRGLTDITGKHGTGGNTTLVQHRVATALDSAITSSSNNPEFVKTMGKDWVPKIKSGQSNTYASDKMDSTQFKGSIGQSVIVDGSDLMGDPAKYKAFVKQMEASGFSYMKAAPLGSDYSNDIVLTYTGVTLAEKQAIKKEKTEYIAREIQADLALADEKANSARRIKEQQLSNFLKTKGAGSSVGSMLNIETESPAFPSKYTTPFMSPIPPSSTQQQILESITNKSPVTKFSIYDTPSDIANFDKVKSDTAAYKAATSPDKLEKNVYGDKCPIGFEAKIDMPAQIRIYPAAGANEQEFNRSMYNYGKSSVGFIDCFLLRSVQSRLEERYFIFQSLNGDTVSFFFGAKPTIYSFSGALLDTYNQQWFNDFRFFYEEYLRGTMSISNNTRIMMVYEDQIIEGFILDMNMSKSAEMNVLANFEFSMLMVQRTHVNGYNTPVERGSSILSDSSVQVASSNTPGSTIVSGIQHMTNLMNGLPNMDIISGQDTWKKVSSAMFGPPGLPTEEVEKQTLDNEIRKEQNKTETPKSPYEVRQAIANAKPGTVMGDMIALKKASELSIEEKLSILNQPSGNTRLNRFI